MNAVSSTIRPVETQATHIENKKALRVPRELLTLLKILAISLAIWYLGPPAALSERGWKLLVIFIATIATIVLKPLPMGAVSMIGIAATCLTKTLPLKAVLQGFAYDQIWLIVFACFLARGVIKTGLGARIAYLFLGLFGGTPYGMGYGILFSSTCMAPLIPSSTARTGGILLPVLQSLIQAVGSKDAKSVNRIAQYLTLITFHGSVITSAMFLTANAGNPIAVKFAQDLGLDVSWMLWAKAAFLPGILTILALPPLMFLLSPCKVENSDRVKEHAKKELASMGQISWQEKILAGVFSALLVLWAFGALIGIHATEAALFGVGLLLIFHVLTWKDLLNEDMAWDTFMWMAVLIMMASQLQELGVIKWFTEQVIYFLPNFSWQAQLGLISLVYFYTHYFFASTTAHVSSMYGPFLAVAIAAGAPPLVSALILSFLSSLFGGLTHYSSGPAPILYSQQHVDLKTWWKVGAISSLFYLLIWAIIGSFWWQWLEI
jgi:DASS family divalent anion:Na+ symporter